MDPDTTIKPVSLPAVWPGAFKLYQYSKAAVMRNLWAMIGLFLFGLVFGSLGGLQKEVTVVKIILTIFSIIVSALVSIATTITVLKGARNERIELGDSLRDAIKIFPKAVAAYILLYLVLILSLVLFIVPFFIVAPRLILMPYYLIDKKLSIAEAFKASWHNSAGNVGKVWGIFGVSLLMLLPIFTIIGILVTIYLNFMYGAAYALLYLYIQRSQKIAEPAAQPIAD